MFYAARTNGLSEENLRREIQTRTGVNDFADLTGHDYQVAKIYLQNTVR